MGLAFAAIMITETKILFLFEYIPLGNSDFRNNDPMFCGFIYFGWKNEEKDAYTFKSIRKDYGKSTAVEDINLELEMVYMLKP